jgi:hypothetical protein
LTGSSPLRPTTTTTTTPVSSSSSDLSTSSTTEEVPGQTEGQEARVNVEEIMGIYGTKNGEGGEITCGDAALMELRESFGGEIKDFFDDRLLFLKNGGDRDTITGQKLLIPLTSTPGSGHGLISMLVNVFIFSLFPRLAYSSGYDSTFPSGGCPISEGSNHGYDST